MGKKRSLEQLKNYYITKYPDLDSIIEDYNNFDVPLTSIVDRY